MSTLLDLRGGVRTTYLKIDPNAKVWDDNTLDYFINRAYSRVQKDFDFDLLECETSTTITTTGGVNEYNRPSDLVRITGFFNNQRKLDQTTKQNTKMVSSDNSEPTSYYQYGNKIGLYPTPDTTYNLDLFYNRKLPKLTNSVDSLLDEDMEDLVILWACYLMFLSVEKQAKAQMCLAQYRDAKDGLFGEKFYNDDLSWNIE